MKRTVHIAIATLAALAIVSVFHSVQPAARAQTGRSSTEGVYTEAQAKRGEQTYAENCSFCHGDDLKGSDVIPAIVGEAFLMAWADKTVGDLYEKISTTMPATAPGSLTAEQNADALAYMLSVSKYPVGTMELAAKLDELKQIRIEPPQQ